MEENKQVLQEIIADLKKGITGEVLSSVEKKLAEWKAKNGLNTTSMKEEGEKATEYIRAKFVGDFAKAKALSPATNNEGKELVPTYLASEIVRVADEVGVVRRNARKFPMAGLNVNYPTMSGVIAYRKTPNGEYTISEPGTAYAFSLAVEEVGSIVPFSNLMLENPTVNVVDALALLAGEAIAKIEDTWGLLGQTSGEGIFQNTNVSVYTLPSGKTSYANITADDLLSTLSLVKGSARKSLRWVMSWSVYNAIRGLKDTQGRYVVQEPSGGQPATIWNVPVEISDVMPETTESSQAGKKFIALANFNYMALGQEKGITMDISREATLKKADNSLIHLFQDNMSAVRFQEYIDIELAEASKAFAVIKTASS